MKAILLTAVLAGSFSFAAAPKNEPSDAKQMLGLDLKPIGNWKPTWDPGARVARWENDDFMSSILIRIVKNKLDTLEDLKAAAPMMMQLGQAITSVPEGPQTTEKGWYATVDGEGTRTFIYVQKYGSKTLVCSASIKKSEMGGAISKATALKACDSIKVK